ncbi:short-chain dehydrogenase/reductase SDR [Segniliparus rotundus DSM 44985]|uniref:Short-chain dehydrogenase/reductase SDR n=1 Tax=Segniliparus rotundus (strain ATCC BAA-972 / CDC 1076 / CIP 108378 / DSM 44985 / JCM 13578) TaxID=640132 RepID=D6ZAN2_SEGRD|nr:SDR family oxidoreductase [Segniliparus rotundus]ADG98768.1 short-chain dehydrogenase/reductase SDR [Segniliparus rotundus DSM 44985]
MTAEAQPRTNGGAASERRRSVTSPSRSAGSASAVTLAVYERGDPKNPTVLFAHGWPDTHCLWNQVAGLLEDRFHVVAYDSRGHGQSTSPRSYRQWRMTDLADDIFAVAEAVSPDAPVHLVAHDWGSVAGWEAVVQDRAKDRLASFTSISGPSTDYLAVNIRETLGRLRVGRLPWAFGQIGSLLYQIFFHMSPLPQALFAVSLGKPAVWRRFLRAIEGTPAKQIELAPTFRKDIANGLRVYWANSAPTAFGKPDPRPTDVPTQLIVNRNDVAIRPGTYDEYSRWVSRLWRHDLSTGHWAAYARPQAIATLVRDFVDGLDGKPSRVFERAAVGARGKGEFSGKLVAITGAGSGIGRETALAFAREGAELVLSDVNDVSVKETVGLVEETGGVAHPYRLDVSDHQAYEQFVAEVVAAHGVPDIVVNNAGISIGGQILDFTEDQVERIVGINVRGVITGSRLFGKHMVERGLGGHIVNLSSLAAFGPARGIGVYAATKSAVAMFSECLRAELHGAGVGVSAILPGIVDTNIVRNTQIAGLSEHDRLAHVARIDKFYQRRGFTPDKVAKRILWAVRKNKAVVPVTIESQLGYRQYRFAPWLSRLIARLELF